MEETKSRVSDLDVLRSANILVEEHGEKAPIHAAMRADELYEEGAYEGYQTWKRIIRATIELLRAEPDENEATN